MRSLHITLRFLALVVLCTTVILLRLNGGLFLYVSPRYEAFTLLASIAGIAIALIGIWQNTKLQWRSILKKHYLLKALELFGLLGLGVVLVVFLPLGFVFVALGLIFLPRSYGLAAKQQLTLFIAGILLMGLFVPPRSLQVGDTVSTANTSGLSGSYASAATMVQVFSYDSSKYDIGEWLRRRSTVEDVNLLVGEKVKLTGFVYEADAAMDDMFIISRFVISCCAVDARPVGFPVLIPNWRENFLVNDWLELEGEFRLETNGSEQVLVVVPLSQPSKINQPGNPYIYL